jgi:30S ribosomal protein S31
MGKGDKKTKRGKITMGSYGVRRPKKKTVVKPTKKAKPTTKVKATAKPKATIKSKATAKSKK